MTSDNSGTRRWDSGDKWYNLDKEVGQWYQWDTEVAQ